MAIVRQVGRVVQQSLFNGAGMIPHPLQNTPNVGTHLSFSTPTGSVGVKPATQSSVLAQTLNFGSPTAAVGLVPQVRP